MVNYAQIQLKVDRGKGKAAAKLGQPFIVYRLESSSTGDYPLNWTEVDRDIPVFRRLIEGQAKIETAIKNATLFYDIIGNMDEFLVGDIFVQNDPPYVPGVSYGAGATKTFNTIQFNAFCLAWHPPVRKAVGGRLDRLCQIYRPASQPQPLSDGTPYWNALRPGDRPLILQNGEFSFGGAGGVASLVPCGLVSAYRPYGEKRYPPAIPGTMRPAHYFVYVPPLPGYHPVEGDAIITQDDARYVVIEAFYQEAGVVGSQLMCDRTGGNIS